MPLLYSVAVGNPGSNSPPLCPLLWEALSLLFASINILNLIRSFGYMLIDSSFSSPSFPDLLYLMKPTFSCVFNKLLTVINIWGYLKSVWLSITGAPHLRESYVPLSAPKANIHIYSKLPWKSLTANNPYFLFKNRGTQMGTETKRGNSSFTAQSYGAGLL